MARDAIKNNIDRDIKAGLPNGIQPAAHNARLKEVLDDSVNKSDDTTDNLTEGSTNKYASRDNVFDLIETNSRITKKGNLIEFDLSGSGGGSSYDDGSIPLTFGGVTSQPHTKLRTVTETGGNAIDIPSGSEHGAAEGGLLVQLDEFFVEIPFSDLLDIPVDATNDTVVDTSGNTQNAILHRSASVGNGYKSVYVGVTSADKLLMLGTSYNGTVSSDVTSDMRIWILEHAHRGTFHRNDPSETTIADADLIGYFDDSESFQPPKLITFSNFKAALNIPTGGGGSFSLNMANLRPVLNTTLLVDSTITKTVDTNANTITLSVASGSTPSGDPTAGQKAYWGGVTNAEYTADSDFSSYTQTADNTAGRTADVRTTGAHFRVTLPIPSQGYGYVMLPNSRPMTHAVNPLGADRFAGFTRTQNAFTIASVSYDVWRLTQQNLLSEAADLIFDITVGGSA